MPKANIDNILKKASAKDSADYKESVFEVSDFVLSVCMRENERRGICVDTLVCSCAKEQRDNLIHT